MLVAWPLHEGACAKEAACAAAACALAMLRLQHSSPAAGEPPLSLHIAIHAGELAELHVGNGDTPGGRWEHMLAGAPLSELAPLVAAAAPGECMASDAVWALLQGRATAGALCAGGARVLDVIAAAAASQHAAGRAGNDDAPSDQMLSALGCYLPPALADTLEAGEQRWMAELRQCSVLFILLPPCGAGDFLLAQELIAEVHACVQRWGGACQQSLCDDKGMVSIGVWGKARARCCGCTACVAMSLARGEATRMSNVCCADASALRPQSSLLRASRTTPPGPCQLPSSWPPA